MSFGSNLRALRTAAGLTQEQLAKKINLSKANVSKYEAGTVEPNLNTLVTICELFDVSADFLLGVSKPNAEGSTSITAPQIAKDIAAINDYYNRLSGNGKEIALEYIKLLHDYENKLNS